MRKQNIKCLLTAHSTNPALWADESFFEKKKHIIRLSTDRVLHPIPIKIAAGVEMLQWQHYVVTTPSDCHLERCWEKTPACFLGKRTYVVTHTDISRHLEGIALSMWACVQGNADLFSFLPLNKKSYSSSRFPILDEAAPTLVSGRGCVKSSSGNYRYTPGNEGKGFSWHSAPVLAVKASWPQKGRAPNSAEGGEESLQRA